MPMTIPTDPAAQYAQLIERVANIAEDVREIKEQQSAITKVLIELAGVRRDLSHTDKSVGVLFDKVDKGSGDTAAIDKRVVGLERWQRFVVGLASIGVAIAISSWQYFRGIEKDMGNNEKRISTMEFIVNSNNFERAMEPPTATGKK